MTKTKSYAILSNNVLEIVQNHTKVLFNSFDGHEIEYINGDIIIKHSGIYEITYNLICTENINNGLASFHLTLNDIIIQNSINQNQLNTINSIYGTTIVKAHKYDKISLINNTNLPVTLYQAPSISLLNNFSFTFLKPDINQHISLNVTLPNYSSIYVGVQSNNSAMGHIVDNFGNIYNLVSNLSQNQVFYFDYSVGVNVSDIIVSGFTNETSVEILIYSNTNTINSSLQSIVQTSNISNEFVLELTSSINSYGIVFASSFPGPSPFISLQGLNLISSNVTSNPTYMVGSSQINNTKTTIRGIIGKSDISAVAISLFPLSTIYGQIPNNAVLSVKCLDRICH